MAYEKALSLLSEVFGNRLSRSSSDLDLHGTSEAHFPVTSPDAVAYVNSTEDVKKLLASVMNKNALLLPGVQVPR